MAAQESVGLADFGRDFNQAVNRLLESSGVAFAAFKCSRDFMKHHFHLGEAFAVHQFGRFIKLFFNNEVARDYLRSLLGNGALGAQRLALGYAPNRGLPGGDNLFYRLNVGSGVGAERRQPDALRRNPEANADVAQQFCFAFVMRMPAQKAFAADAEHRGAVTVFGTDFVVHPGSPEG